MFGTKRLAAHDAVWRTGWTTHGATGSAGDELRRDPLAGRAFLGTGGAIGLAVDRTHRVETGAEQLTAAGAGRQAVAAEALAAGAAVAESGGVLPAARTAQRARVADQAHAAVGRGDVVGAQVALALQRAAHGALPLAGQADGVAADRAAGKVVGYAWPRTPNTTGRTRRSSPCRKPDKGIRRTRADDCLAGGALANESSQVMCPLRSSAMAAVARPQAWQRGPCRLPSKRFCSTRTVAVRPPSPSTISATASGTSSTA